MKSFKELMAPRHYADGALISAKLPPAYEKAKVKRIVLTAALMYRAQSIVKLGTLKCVQNIIVKNG